MEGEKLRGRFSLLLLLLMLGVIPKLHANIGDFDEVWQKRAKDAHQAALEAYDPNPELVTNHLNQKVHMSLASNKTNQQHVSGLDMSISNFNKTRRQLRVNKGRCQATNPIDRCWRCQLDWAQHRKRLANCALGFGRKTIGGRNGRIYVVTDPSDNDLQNPVYGTLRHAVIQDEPLWIIFSRNMIIRLSEELIMNSHKTIDARGFNIHIANGAGITIQFITNVIIHGLHIHNIHAGNGGTIRDSPTHFGTRTRSDGDGISIFGSSNIWLDHLSMSKCTDGIIDAIEGSTGITISNCHFTDHDEVLLMGASDSQTKDTIMQVTIAFNHFGRRLVQRMPRCRYGFFHVVNNDYTHWIMYAVGGNKNPTIISQGNRYIAPHLRNAKEVTKREYTDESIWKDWVWKSEGDLLQNGAVFVQSGPKLKRHFSSQDMITAKPGSFVSRLTRFAGSLNCKKDSAC